MMPCNRRRTIVVFSLVSCVVVSGLGVLFASLRARDIGEVPTLYLVGVEPDNLRFVAADGDTTRSEPNLIIITHGWYEREPWPEAMALAIARRVDRQAWCCGWYDWRGPAGRLLPSDAARVARDDAGPRLGQQVIGLGTHWRHVHLIGHSAGSWLINEAAAVIAEHTTATIHLTFLDAYVPHGWDQKALGRLVGDPCETCWADHYFTRDPLNLTENVLPWACNVDITEVNPGFKGHRFPCHWYEATIAGRYGSSGRFADANVVCEFDGTPYGYARSLEAGSRNWAASTILKAPRDTVGVSDRQ